MDRKHFRRSLEDLPDENLVDMISAERDSLFGLSLVRPLRGHDFDIMDFLWHECSRRNRPQLFTEGCNRWKSQMIEKKARQDEARRKFFNKNGDVA